jgi:hypothetical protein
VLLLSNYHGMFTGRALGYTVKPRAVQIFQLELLQGDIKYYVILVNAIRGGVWIVEQHICEILYFYEKVFTPLDILTC